MLKPTPQQLKDEIESGPLAPSLAAAWSDVFPTEPEPFNIPKPADDEDNAEIWEAWQARQRWERICYRFGRLTPDACFELRKILADVTLRSKPHPMAVASFAVFLAMRGLLRKIKDYAANPVGVAQVRDICDLIITTVQAAPDRTVDPADPQVIAMINALISVSIATESDRTAFLGACTKPCSRLTELGWSPVTDDELRAAKML